MFSRPMVPTNLLQSICCVICGYVCESGEQREFCSKEHMHDAEKLRSQAAVILGTTTVIRVSRSCLADVTSCWRWLQMES